MIIKRKSQLYKLKKKKIQANQRYKINIFNSFLGV